MFWPLWCILRWYLVTVPYWRSLKISIGPVKKAFAWGGKHTCDKNVFCPGVCCCCSANSRNFTVRLAVQIFARHFLRELSRSAPRMGGIYSSTMARVHSILGFLETRKTKIDFSSGSVKANRKVKKGRQCPSPLECSTWHLGGQLERGNSALVSFSSSTKKMERCDFDTDML